MENMQNLLERMIIFERSTIDNKNLRVHKNNKFSRQFSIFLRDWNYLKIIINRIEQADPENDSAQLGLDLKSLYVFGRVYSESLIYMASLFVSSSEKIKWKKIGPFIKSIQDHLSSEPDEFKAFWKANERSIKTLFETFKYRNDVLHEKDSNTEWTFATPGISNLVSVYIENVPWAEDKGVFKEKKTLNAANIVKILNSQSLLILDYLASLN